MRRGRIYTCDYTGSARDGYVPTRNENKEGKQERNGGVEGREKREGKEGREREYLFATQRFHKGGGEIITKWEDTTLSKSVATPCIHSTFYM